MNSFHPSLLVLHCFTAHVFVLKKGGGSASEEPLAKPSGVKQDRDNEKGEGDPMWEGSGSACLSASEGFCLSSCRTNLFRRPAIRGPAGGN